MTHVSLDDLVAALTHIVQTHTDTTAVGQAAQQALEMARSIDDPRDLRVSELVARCLELEPFLPEADRFRLMTAVRVVYRDRHA